MQSRILFVSLFVLICVAFAFAQEETVTLPGKQFRFNPEKWKQVWTNFSKEDRAQFLERTKNWINSLGGGTKEALLENVSEILLKHQNYAQIFNTDSDMAELTDETEFVCGGLCIAGGIAVLGGIGLVGNHIGRKQGEKAPPVYHHHYNDDDALSLSDYINVYKMGRDAAYNLFIDKHPGRETHVYVDDDTDADTTENIDLHAFKKFIKKWHNTPGDEKTEMMSELNEFWNNLPREDRDFYAKRMEKLSDARYQLLAGLADADVSDEAEFICGGVCIAAAGVLAVGVFQGSRMAGKENTTRHIHVHHSK